MFKLFRKKLNKKGFTLAEMLIVVAIIAILVAIAIPIFTSALDKAHKAARDANIRSVKAAAIYEILDKWETGTGKNYGYTDYSAKTPAKSWLVEAKINEGGKGNGQIHIISITAQASDGSSAGEPGYTTDSATGEIHITNLTIRSVELPS